MAMHETFVAVVVAKQWAFAVVFCPLSTCWLIEQQQSDRDPTSNPLFLCGTKEKNGFCFPKFKDSPFMTSLIMIVHGPDASDDDIFLLFPNSHGFFHTFVTPVDPVFFFVFSGIGPRRQNSPSC